MKEKHNLLPIGHDKIAVNRIQTPTINLKVIQKHRTMADHLHSSVNNRRIKTNSSNGLKQKNYVPLASRDGNWQRIRNYV